MINEIDLMRRNTLGDLLRKNSRKIPNKKAVISYLEGESDKCSKLTFKELNTAANRFANGLTKLGINKGDVAAIMCHNCMQFVIFTWGCIKAGVTSTFVNVNLVDHEIAFQINHSEAKILFTEDSLSDIVLNAKDEIKGVQQFGYIDLKNKPVPAEWMNIEELYSEKYSSNEPEVEIRNNDVIFRMYTSGTTAFPKGIDLTYSNSEYICHSFARNDGGGLAVDDVQGYFVPLYHSAILFMCTSITLGSTLVVGSISDLGASIDIIEKEKVSFSCLPVTVFTRLIDSPLRAKLSSMKRAWWFGGAMPLEVLSKWFELFPHISIIAQWSQSECLVGTLSWFNKNTGLPKAGNVIGKPYLDTEIKIVDADDNEVPDGTPGEIAMRSPAVMKGYCKNPEATAEAFRNGWHHTGDVGVRAEDGYYYFVDRVKDMIKTGGVNVSAMEVEAVLNSMEGVTECAVFGIEHPDWIEAVACAVVSVKEHTENDVINYCKGNIAKFKVPKRVIFIDEIPKNHVGKLLRKNLRETYKDLFKNKMST